MDVRETDETLGLWTLLNPLNILRSNLFIPTLIIILTQLSHCRVCMYGCKPRQSARSTLSHAESVTVLAWICTWCYPLFEEVALPDRKAIFSLAQVSNVSRQEFFLASFLPHILTLWCSECQTMCHDELSVQGTYCKQTENILWELLT